MGLRERKSGAVGRVLKGRARRRRMEIRRKTRIKRKWQSRLVLWPRSPTARVRLTRSRVRADPFAVCLPRPVARLPVARLRVAGWVLVAWLRLLLSLVNSNISRFSCVLAPAVEYSKCTRRHSCSSAHEHFRLVEYVRERCKIRQRIVRRAGRKDFVACLKEGCPVRPYRFQTAPELRV